MALLLPPVNSSAQFFTKDTFICLAAPLSSPSMTWEGMTPNPVNGCKSGKSTPQGSLSTTCKRHHKLGMDTLSMFIGTFWCYTEVLAILIWKLKKEKLSTNCFYMISRKTDGWTQYYTEMMNPWPPVLWKIPHKASTTIILWLNNLCKLLGGDMPTWVPCLVLN